MKAKNINLRDVQNFVRRELPKLIESDLLAYRLLREADVECAAYMHLRRLLDQDDRWKVTARRHVRQTGHYVDLMIFKDTQPKIAIELKWGRTAIDKKDRKSLQEALKKAGVNKAYWISVSMLGRSPLLSLEKIQLEKYTLHQVCVRGGLDRKRDRSEYDNWVRFRDSLRSKLEPGSGRKLVSVDADDK